MKKLFKNITFVFAGLTILTSCIDENFDDSSTVGLSEKELLLNVVKAENQSNDLDIFIQLVEENGLSGILTSRRTQDQRTVFVPTDNAFELLLEQLQFNSLEELLASDIDLLQVLESHIALANLTVNQIENGSFDKIATFSGFNIPVKREAGGFVLNDNEDLEVVRSNTNGNGTVHIISRVVLP